MSGVIITAKKLREALTEKYHVDHVIGLQLLSAVLLENNIDDSANHYCMIAAAKFAKYFNKSWNLQIIDRQENENKKKAVLEYIKWKYEDHSRRPRKSVFNEISKIFEHYDANRDTVLDDINNDLIGHRNKLRNVEISLYTLLECENCKHPDVSFDDILDETADLHDAIHTQYDLDHIVEMQILAEVLVDNKITRIPSAAKFADYFNEDWNFQIMEKHRNQSKGKNITEWLEWIQGDISNKPNRFVFNTKHFVFKHYENNRNFVLDDIESDQRLSHWERNLFRQAEMDLYQMLSS